MAKQVKYEDLCTPSKLRDPNTGELVDSDADFKKPENKPEEKNK